MAREKLHDLQGLLNNPIVPQDLYDESVKPMIQDFKTIAGVVGNILRALKRGEDVSDMAREMDHENVALQQYIEGRIEELESCLHEDVQLLVCGVMEELGCDVLISKVQSGSVIHTICQLHTMCGYLNGMRERVANGVMYRIQQEDEEKEQEPGVENHDGVQEVAGECSDMDLC